MGPSSINSHLVWCRGGEWRIEPHSRGFVVSPRNHPEGWFSHLSWNGKAWLNCSWPNHPAWLPVAWLCCEADPAEGPKFAAAILDAWAGDDAPALIACDWLGDTSLEGRLEYPATGASDNSRMLGWTQWRQVSPGRPSGGGAYAPPRHRTGPLASWCRHLIDTRCVACGGRRDGEDQIPIAIYSGRPKVLKRRKEILPWPLGGSPDQEPFCPLCGFPAHPTPPPLAIPEVVK